MANEYLRRTPTSTGNRRVWTASLWYKMSSAGAFFGAGDGSTAANSSHWWFNSDQLGYSNNDGTNYITVLRKSRDFSSWSHYMLVVDTTKVEPYDRVVFYENGVRNEVDTTSGYTNPSRNAELSWINQLYAHHIGARNRAGANTFSTGEYCDFFFIDGQALTPDVFGFYKQGKGYISAGSTQATDFRPGQWVPKTPRVIKTEIIRRGGFGVNGFYLPMNDSNNFGADFHCDPNSIITLNEKLPQPRVGVATTASVGLGYTDALRADPYAANLVLALPFVSSGLATDGTSSGTNRGFGDYSHIIRGSGSAKVATLNGNVAIANTASYYGSVGITSGADYLRFPNSSDFAFGGGQAFTMEGWFNLTTTSESSALLIARRGDFSSGGTWGGLTGYQYICFYYNLTQQIYFQYYNGSSVSTFAAPVGIVTSGQWNHLAVQYKAPNLSMYVNGACVAISTNPNLVNITTPDRIVIGEIQAGRTYQQDIRVYNTAKYTGGFDVPKPYTPVGIATWRAVPDTTANNFATLNRLYNSVSGNVVLVDGNLTYTGSQSPSYGLSQATVGVSTNKWYWEVRVGATGPNLGIGVMRPGISNSSATTNPEYSFISGVDGGIGFYHGAANTIYYWTGTTQTSVSYTLPACTTGDIVSVALDLTGGDNSKIYFAKNGTWGASGDPATGTNPVGLALSGTYAPAISIGAAGASTASFNFGQNPTFSGNTTAGTFTDSNSKGLFKYQPPSGFLALCEDNLPTPAISNPGQYFKTVLYAGDGNSGRSIVGVGFTPDLVWIKRRDVGGVSHNLADSVRGPGLVLFSDATNSDFAGTDRITSFNSDGFSIGNNSGVNGSGNTFVAWCWRAGAGTTSTNTNGSITSVVSVNQDAGFSIVSYTGNGVDGATIGHGLGKSPAFIIAKGRDNAVNWPVYHKSTTASNFLYLNSTSAALASSAMWNSNPSSSVFYVGNQAQNNTNALRYIAYCWTEIEGFSKFGSYVGNGNADGPFVYCGFKPAFVLVKNASATVSWTIVDNARDSVNGSFNSILFPDLSEPDNAGGNKYYDFVSNGFKIRGASSAINANGNTMIFAAFAESPFSYSNSK